MDLKKCFMVSLFLLAPVSHVNAIDLHEVVGQLQETTRHTKIAYRVDSGEDFEAPKLSKRQDACFTALETELDGYEAKDYMLHSFDQREQPLYGLYLTHWVPSIPAADIEEPQQQNKRLNVEIPKKVLQLQSQQEASEGLLERDQKPNSSLSESQSIHHPEADEHSNAQHEEPRSAEPAPDEESDESAPPVKVSKQRAEEQQRFQQEGPRKKGLIMLWTLNTPEEREEEGPVDVVRAKAELIKAARLTSLNMVIQKIRDADTDHLYLSEDFPPAMQAIVKNMGVTLLKPNTGFTTVSSNGEPRIINDLSESLLLDR